MSTPQNDRLRELLSPPVEAAGAELEDVTLTPAGKRRVLRVVVDADGGVDLDRVADISHAVSELLDGSDVLGERPYTLEVTTPGTDRPLTALRHWQRAEGRLVDLKLTDGTSLTARVASSDEEGADVSVEAPAVKGRRPRPVPRRIAFAEVASARVQVEFSKPKPAEGMDTDQDQEEA
ncbi:ribosome maturation factor RimP [Mangrovactinospora gilvigrisea]|uniref:Ribosome maturation factor RimP n=1 Tax=Mangrovactinospora gilvigrisea TaxID=1428644 RepID=A0A1J7B9V6_9ACTN|nr:ribosome maturation factor RimP [Mangrovactinospora gilvigrisea]OIV35381.1 ribosome maturation factor RimP [Mangrovactinospora gilvigrisea]